MLALARQLYCAATTADERGSYCKPRLLAAPVSWRPSLQATFLPPTLTPEEMDMLRSPRSPAHAAAHLEALVEGSPWSLAGELQYDPASLSLMPSASFVGPLDGPNPAGHTATSAAAARADASTASSSSSPKGTAQRRLQPTSRWPTVRELVQAWSRSRTRSREGEQGDGSGAGEGSVRGTGIAAADVLLRGPVPLHTPVDVEAQRAEVPCQLPEARALTWCQLGIAQGSTQGSRHSESGSRRQSETGALPPPLPPRASAFAAVPLHGEVHANPMFAPLDWSSPGGAAAAGNMTWPAPGLAGSIGSSFSHQIRRVPSRLSRGSSFADRPRSADPLPGLPLEAAARMAAVEESAHSHLELSSHGQGLGHSHGSWHSLHHAGNGPWVHTEPQGAGMRTRPSRESLMHSQAEPEGLGRISEDP